MRAMHRVVLLAAFAAFASTLAACSNFDPDKLDVFGLNEKKKLPGERRELFPQGVPGVTQGIPPEYMKGNQPPPETAQAPAGEPGSPAAAAAESAKKTAAVEPEPQPKPKRKPKPRTVSQPPAKNEPQGAAQQQPAPWPQQSQQPAPQQAQAPWPGQAQGQSNAAGSPWPSSPPSTVAR
jgi:outer membrane biosynthesis protein TonB